MADIIFKVHDHTTQVFLNGFCLFLPHHLVISVCLLGAAVYCGKPLVAYSHVINEEAAQYHYPATVRMSCDEGYKRADGSNALKCLASGKWNATSLRCKRKWSSGVRYHLVRFCVCLFFWQNLIQPQIRFPAANYFHFHLLRGNYFDKRHVCMKPRRPPMTNAHEDWRRSGQSVTASNFGSKGPRFESGRGRCVESLDKALYSHWPKEKPSH